MWKKIRDMVPKRTVVNLTVCLVATGAIILMGIVPNIFTLNSLDTRIAKVRSEVEEQKALVPMYQVLKAQAEKKATPVLPSPQKRKLPGEEIQSLASTFHERAKRVNMTILSFSPEIKTSGEGSRILSVDMVVAGDFYDFRKFLVGLGEMPYVERVEEMHIQPRYETLEFKVKVIIALA